MDSNPFPEPKRRAGRGLQCAATFFAIFSSAAAAFGIYVVLLTQVLVPAGVIPIEVDRTIRRAEFLRGESQKGTSPILFFGSSVVLEGVDSKIVESVLGDGASVYNIAESNAGVRNLMMNLPLISAAKPQMLICCLRRSQLDAEDFPDLPSELLIGYAFSGYVDTRRRTPEWIYRRLSDQERESLPGNALSKLLACRVFLLRAMEQEIRHRVRPDLRTKGFASNFRDPWRYTRQIPSDRLDMLIERSRKSFAELRFDAAAPVAEALGACLRFCRETKVPFLLVLTPENPLIQATISEHVREKFDAAVAAFTHLHGADFFVLNAGLFAPEHFLDHSHVNAAGREIFSRTLGMALAERIKN